MAVIDSIQALHDAELSSAPGRWLRCVNAPSLQRLAKKLDIALLLVGRVTEGMLAGPRCEHLDAVLTFEGIVLPATGCCRR